MGRLTGRTTIIAGGSKGIGYAISTTFAPLARSLSARMWAAARVWPWMEALATSTFSGSSAL